VATNLSELAGILLNKAEDGKLQALLKVDLSLEALLNMDQVRSIFGTSNARNTPSY
jgi:hypothetical protein